MSKPAASNQARFLTGSTWRHVIIMTLTGALGLMSLFLVDLADLYFLPLLQITEVTAAAGYAGTIVPDAVFRSEAGFSGDLGDCTPGHADPARNAIRQCLYHL